VGQCPLWVKSGHDFEPAMSGLPPKSGHRLSALECPLRAKSGLMHRSKQGPFGAVGQSPEPHIYEGDGAIVFREECGPHPLLASALFEFQSNEPRQ
jgi:hypothetical protein